MANYDWFQDQRNAYEEAHTRYWEFKGLGFERIYFRSDDSIELYKCMRGCGTVVHDPYAHIENVCRDEDA